jgi:hypothetical protein
MPGISLLLFDMNKFKSIGVVYAKSFNISPH